MQSYRNQGFTKYSELLTHLLVAEKNNELLMKSHQLRPTGSAPRPEINNTGSNAPRDINPASFNSRVQNGYEQSRGNRRGGHGNGYGNYRGNRGRGGYGRGRGNFGRGRGRGHVMKRYQGNNSSKYHGQNNQKFKNAHR